MIHLDAYEWEGRTYVRTWETDELPVPRLISRFCDYCGVDLAGLPPGTNVYPHVIGACAHNIRIVEVEPRGSDECLPWWRALVIFCSSFVLMVCVLALRGCR